MLTNQLKAHGDAPVEEVLTLAQAKERLMAALALLMEGDESAQEEFDRFDKFINNHPESIAAKALEEKDWIERNAAPNAASLSLLRSFVPPDVFSTNLSRLKAELPEKIAERVFSRKILWLVRADPSMIVKVHIAELKTKFQAHSLDLDEIRAIVSILPAAFENDADRKKMEWKDKLVERLREMVKKVDSGDARVGLRDKAYLFSKESEGEGESESERGPFDPDAPPVKQAVNQSTPFSKAGIEDIRSLCKGGGTFNVNRETLKASKSAAATVVPNKERIDPSKIGKVREGNEGFLEKLEKCLGGGGGGGGGKREEGGGSRDEEVEPSAARGNPLKSRGDIKSQLEALFGGKKEEDARPPIGKRKEKVETGAAVEATSSEGEVSSKDAAKAKLEAFFGGKQEGDARPPIGKRKEQVETGAAVEATTSEGGVSSKDAAKAKLEALFGGKQEEDARPPIGKRKEQVETRAAVEATTSEGGVSSKDAAKAKLEALFGGKQEKNAADLVVKSGRAAVVEANETEGGRSSSKDAAKAKLEALFAGGGRGGGGGGGGGGNKGGENNMRTTTKSMTNTPPPSRTMFKEITAREGSNKAAGDKICIEERKTKIGALVAGGSSGGGGGRPPIMKRAGETTAEKVENKSQPSEKKSFLAELRDIKLSSKLSGGGGSSAEPPAVKQRSFLDEIKDRAAAREGRTNAADDKENAAA